MSLYRRYSEAFWLDLQQQYEQSGQTFQAFCAQVGVSPSGFRGWKKGTLTVPCKLLPLFPFP